jgi:hypothetical protein
VKYSQQEQVRPRPNGVAELERATPVQLELDEPLDFGIYEFLLLLLHPLDLSVACAVRGTHRIYFVDSLRFWTNRSNRWGESLRVR